MVAHYVQLDKKFKQFDFHDSKKNKEKYGSIHPQEYNLAAISVPVHLFYGKKDPLATEEVIFEIM